MQPETTRRRPPDPWPFSPVPRPGDRQEQRPSAAPSLGPPTRDPARDQAPDQTPDRDRDDADELVARLRARRSASGVAAAYAAAHGHPADPRAEQGTRRWALSGTTAVVAVVAVLLLGLGVAALSLRDDGVVPLAPLPDDAASDGGSADGAAADPVPGTDPVFGPRGGHEHGTKPGAGPEPDGGPESGGVLVHVVGAVAKPGVVTVPDGARVADALQAAGGATGKADLAAVNLARTVVDGEQLYVPRPGEQPPVPAGTGTPAAPGSGATEGGPGSTVDINTADAVALEALPGVGPSIAQAIVEWRAANGPFADVDELEDVPGIGPATLEEIRDSARVGP